MHLIWSLKEHDCSKFSIFFSIYIGRIAQLAIMNTYLATLTGYTSSILFL